MDDRPQPAWGSLPFQQAIDFFQAKKLVPTERWSDLLGEGHDTGFMVAGITKADMLADFHQSILKNMAAGIPLKAWTETDFKAICDHYGWEPKQGREWRAKIILEHNIRTAYQAGRYRQMSDPALIKLMPYWMYRHSNSSRVPRPLHVKWNGLILPANDPWFHTHYPPNGWGCKCRVFPITRQELARMGRTEPDTAPDDGHREWTNPSTGKTLLVPNGIDPGWDYCPGATPMARRIERLVVEKIAKLPEPLAEAVKKDAMRQKTAREEKFRKMLGVVYHEFLRGAKAAVTVAGAEDVAALLSDAELAAAHGYTTSHDDFGYALLNAAMRGGGKKELDRLRPYIDTVVSALDALPDYTGEVMRGAVLPPDELNRHQVGKVVTYPAFTSASLSEGFGGPHRLIIESRHGKVVESLSAYGSEREVLFKPNTSFKVTSRAIKNGEVYVWMREIE